MKQTISERFGKEWSEFPELLKEDEKLFLDWIKPIKPEFFKGKTIFNENGENNEFFKVLYMLYCRNNRKRFKNKPYFDVLWKHY